MTLEGSGVQTRVHLLPFRIPALEVMARLKLRCLLLIACTAVVAICICLPLLMGQSRHITGGSATRTTSSESAAHHNIKTILYWDNYFWEPWGKWWPTGELHCTHGVKCRLTENQSEYQESSALMLHHTSNDAKSILPNHRHPNQIWVYVNQESPINSGDFYNNPDIINWTMSHIREADIWFPFGEIVSGKFKGGFNSQKNYLRNKTKSVAAMMSNCLPHRMNFVSALAKHIDVDVFGGCGTKEVCWYRNCSGDHQRFKPYKFYLALENSFCRDYVTGNLYWSGLQLGMVPIVVGGANYSDPRIAPPGGYIDASKFKSAKELAAFLKILGSQPQEYNQYFYWHSAYDISYTSKWSAICKVCSTLYNQNSTKSYKDVKSWYNGAGKCQSYHHLQ